MGIPSKLCSLSLLKSFNPFLTMFGTVQFFRNMTVLETMTYNKRLLNYVGKFIEKQESSTSPNTECNGKSDGTVFQTLFPCAVESELSVNSVRAWLKVVTHFHHVHNLHSVVLYRPYSRDGTKPGLWTHGLDRGLDHGPKYGLKYGPKICDLHYGVVSR